MYFWINISAFVGWICFSLIFHLTLCYACVFGTEAITREIKMKQNYPTGMVKFDLVKLVCRAGRNGEIISAVALMDQGWDPLQAHHLRDLFFPHQRAGFTSREGKLSSQVSDFCFNISYWKHSRYWSWWGTILILNGHHSSSIYWLVHSFLYLWGWCPSTCHKMSRQPCSVQFISS